MKYLIKIKYLGTAFHGFQVQPNKRTVQGELNSALNLCFGKPCSVTGCSRTDAGVHASEFCAMVVCDGATVPPERLPLAAARFLPSDISIMSAEEAEDGFHPRYDVTSKEYLYRIYNAKVNDPFEYGRSWFLPRIISKNQINRMNEAAKYIVGCHDFKSFMSEGSDTDDTVREVKYLTVEKTSDIINVRIAADGFLYNMVRIIVGTLSEVAFGRIEPSEIEKIIESKNRALAGPTAPPEGLYLNKVNY